MNKMVRPTFDQALRDLPATGLTGIRGILTRTSKDNGRLHFQALELTEQAERCGSDIDPLPTLLWLWSWPQGKR